MRTWDQAILAQVPTRYNIDLFLSSLILPPKCAKLLRSRNDAGNPAEYAPKIWRLTTNEFEGHFKLFHSLQCYLIFDWFYAQLHTFALFELKFTWKCLFSEMLAPVESSFTFTAEENWSCLSLDLWRIFGIHCQENHGRNQPWCVSFSLRGLAAIATCTTIIHATEVDAIVTPAWRPEIIYRCSTK